jgi:hypothetical protein
MSISKIIPNTIKIFSSPYILEKVKDLTKIEEDDYKKLHPQFLTPLSLKIDINKFSDEITKFDSYFKQWSFTHQHLPRFSIPLVNLDGDYKNDNDPSNGSLTEWNKQHLETMLLETDFRKRTAVLDLASLTPLQVFDNYWTRSNILKWNYGAEFVPHIDTAIPSYWLRLWGTTDPAGLELSYYDTVSEQWIEQTNIEAGRIYIIDTSLIHRARSISSTTVYQFFLSVDPTAKELLWKLM